MSVIQVLITNFGLQLKWTGRYYVKVSLPGSFQGQLCGLCGNYDGDRSNDYVIGAHCGDTEPGLGQVVSIGYWYI